MRRECVRARSTSRERDEPRYDASMRAIVASVLLASCGAHPAASATPGPASSLTATPLFCAYGGVGTVPDPLPPGYETEFASIVIAVENAGAPIEHVSVTTAALLDASGATVATLHRIDHVVVLGAIAPTGPTMGTFAVHLNPTGVPFDGTLPTGRTNLRARFSIDSVSTAIVPTQFRIELNANGTVLVVTGPVDGSWPT
jgi:hypothetical protein